MALMLWLDWVKTDQDGLLDPHNGPLIVWTVVDPPTPLNCLTACNSAYLCEAEHATVAAVVSLTVQCTAVTAA
jgi:hypothetical protein